MANLRMVDMFGDILQIEVSSEGLSVEIVTESLTTLAILNKEQAEQMKHFLLENF